MKFGNRKNEFGNQKMTSFCVIITFLYSWRRISWPKAMWSCGWASCWKCRWSPSMPSFVRQRSSSMNQASSFSALWPRTLHRQVRIIKSSDAGDGIFWLWGSILCLLMPWHQGISRHGIGCVGQTTCIVVPDYNYTPRFNEVERGVYWYHLVRLSVCGQNRVCSVSSTILIGSISYLHILSSNFRRCVACNAHFKIQKFEILANFLNL